MQLFGVKTYQYIIIMIMIIITIAIEIVIIVIINNYWMRLSMLAIIIKAKVCVIC